MMRLSKKIFGILTLCLIGASTLFASNVRTGQDVRIDEPVSGNLYTAGGDIQMLAPIGGDIVAAGGEITVRDSVAGDVLIAGGEITLNGFISDDLRVFGGEIEVNGSVRGDLLVAGGEVTLAPGATVYGDLLVSGGKINIKGAVRGKLQAAGGEVVLEGPVDSDIELRGGRVRVDGAVRGASLLASSDLQLGPNASFAGNVRYWDGDGSVDFSDHLREGATASRDDSLEIGVDFTSWKAGFRKAAFAITAFKFLSGAVLIVLLITFFSGFFSRHAGDLTESVGSSLGYGVLYLLLVPVIAIFAFITVIGIPVGFILTAGYSITLILAGALISTLIAYELRAKMDKDWTTPLLMLVAIGVSLVLRLVDMIPFAGNLILFVLTAVGLGYIYQKTSSGSRAESQMSRDSEEIV